MTTCRNCGAHGQDERFCTGCGSVVAESASPARRSVRPAWLVVAALALVVACAFTAVVVLRSGTAPSLGQPDPVAAADRAEDSTVTASPVESAEQSSAAPSAVVLPVALPLNPTVIVLDASGSMKNEDAPGSRIDAAKNAVRALVDALPDGAPVGLLVYGTSTNGSDAAKAAGCQDIRTLVPLGPVDKSTFDAAVDGVAASGYTPIGSSLRTAAAQLPASGERNVVVVSDGEDTCAPPEPCDVAKELAGPGLAIHTVGFRVSGPAKDQLTCIAQAGGGQYVDAGNAVQLQAFLRTAVDPNAAVNALRHDGFGDLSIGMSLQAAKTVDPAIDAATSGTVVVVWRDCDLTFTDGVLTAIAPRTSIPTQDGLAAGDDVAKAAQLYGSSAVQTDDGRTHAVFAVEPESEVGYDITYTPTAAGQLAGPITTIVLCRCRSGPSTSLTAVNADDFRKTEGRWWFRTPDDGWNCSVTANRRVFCDAFFKPNKDAPYSSTASYPPVTSADEASADCGEIELVAGSVFLEPGRAQYGQCGRGEVSEFVYDLDKGVPGPGRILADGQELRAGGFRCFVSGLAVTCASDASNGVGFTVDQNHRQVYPRDGAIPDPGNTSCPTAGCAGTSPASEFDQFVGTWARHTSQLEIKPDMTGSVMYGSGCCNSVEVPVTYGMNGDNVTLTGTVAGEAVYTGSSFKDLHLPVGTEFRFHFEQSVPYSAGDPTGLVIVQDNVIGGSDPLVWCGDVYDGRCGA